MPRRSGAALALAGLVVHAVLLGAAPDTIPAPARVVLACAVLVLLPGAAFVALGAVPPGRSLLAAGWAFGFGVAWVGALVLVVHSAGLPFTVLAGWSMAATGALWAFVLLWPGRGGLSPRPERLGHRPPGESAPSGPWALSAQWTFLSMGFLLLACIVGALHAARLGAPLGLETDSPDHVGTIRRMVASGEPFPRDAFFRDAGEAGADPRKGLWHSGVALIAVLAKVDVIDAWRWLPALLVPLFALNAAVFGFLLRGPPGAAVAAWALVLTYGGSLAAQYLREAVFATKVGDQLALATTAAVLADLAMPSRRFRWAAVGLGLGALAAHVYYAIQFAMVFTALGAGLLIAGRGWSARLTRLTVTALAIGAAGLPWLLWRASQSYAPNNVIHTAPQGLMAIAGDAWIVSPGVLWDWLGSWWILFPLALPWLIREARRDSAVLFLVTTQAVVALVIFNPIVVGVLQPRLGYLLMRMVWMLPLAALLAWMLPSLAAAVRRRSGAAKLAPALALAGIVWLSWDPLRDATWVLGHPAEAAALEERRGASPWREDLDWMKENLPDTTVVLSDPATSYSIPMVTGLYVATLVDQHSSPNDSLALRRILDARDALDPWGRWERLREVVDRYGVDVIALNDRFGVPPVLDYWSPGAEWFRAARVRLDSAPAAFERVHDRGDFVVYRVRRGPALDALSTPPYPDRPFVYWMGSTEQDLWRPTDEPLQDEDRYKPLIMNFWMSPRTAAPGDTIAAAIAWKHLVKGKPGSYQVAVRFDQPVPNLSVPRWMGKPARKIVERLRGERYRFRSDHLPVGGAYGVDLWTGRQWVRDSFTVVVPSDVASGDYAIRVRMLEQPHYPNYRLSDYFFEDDYYSGWLVDTLRVRRPAPSGGG